MANSFVLSLLGPRQSERIVESSRFQIGDTVAYDRGKHARVVSIDEYLQEEKTLPILSQIRVYGGQEVCLKLLIPGPPQYRVMLTSCLYSINPQEVIEAVRKRAEKGIFDGQLNNNPEETLNAQERMYRDIEIIQKLIKE